MPQTLIRPYNWASDQFAEVQMGDQRRTRRLVKVAAALAQSAGGTLPLALPQWADLKAAYRLLANPQVSYEKILAPHWKNTLGRAHQPGEYLMIEDTTDVDFSGRQEVEGLGWTGDGGGQGIYLHSTLAVQLIGWDQQGEPIVEVLGLLGQKWWVRLEEPKTGRESRSERLQRPRESQRWAQVFEALPSAEAQARWIYVADRDSDVYEVFKRLQAKGIEYVIRASHQRALAEGDGYVFETVACAPVQGRFSVRLRARPAVAARRAHLQLRSVKVTLRAPWRPGGRPPPVSLWVVEAREVGAPSGVMPIRWVLLTSLSCQSFERSRRVVKIYAQRWLIEQYHKALKTGAGIEQSQLSTVQRITALLGILALVAVRLLQMKFLAASRPQQPIGADCVGAEALAVLEARAARPPGGWTNKTFLIAIARLGGFLARKGDGLPGWLTLWRGWQRLMILVEGFTIAQESA